MAKRAASVIGVSRTPIKAMPPQPSAVHTVLTGDTLYASLKMRADTSHAAYVIYWAVAGDHFVVGGDFVRDDFQALTGTRGSTYPQRSAEFRLSVDGKGPIAVCYRERRNIIIVDVETGDIDFDADGTSATCVAPLRRLEKAKMFKIGSVAFTPFESGVLEFGTCTALQPASWPRMPHVPLMPKREMKLACSSASALATASFGRRTLREARPSKSLPITRPRAIVMRSRTRAATTSPSAR